MTIAPGQSGYPRHCHSSEEELFVFLAGAGTARVGDEEVAVRAGHVLSRPSGTTARAFLQRGPGGARDLAYGQRANNDIIYYPDSGKVWFAGSRRDRPHRAARLLGRGGSAA